MSKPEQAIAAVSESVGVPLVLAADWAAWAIVDRDVVVGGVLLNRNEVHVGLTRHIYQRGLIRELFAKVLGEYGSAVTKVRASNARGRRFVERLGFRQTSDGDVIAYELKELRHG